MFSRMRYFKEMCSARCAVQDTTPPEKFSVIIHAYQDIAMNIHDALCKIMMDEYTWPQNLP